MKIKSKTFLWRFSIVYLKNNLLKNIFVFLSLLISFSSLIIAVGFYEGTNLFLLKTQEKIVDINHYSITKKETYSFESSPLKLVKTKRPQKSDLLFLDNYLDEYVLSNDYAKIFPGQYALSYENEQVDECFFAPFYALSELKKKEDLLTYGMIQNDNNLFDIYINETLANTLNSDLEKLINSELFFNGENKIIYEFNLPVELNYDTFFLQTKFKICGIFKELTFLNEGKIFYSYSALETYLKGIVLSNLSDFRSIKTSIYDLFSLLDDDSYLHNYELKLFIFSSKDYQTLSSLIKMLNNSDSHIEITSTSEMIKNAYYELTRASFYSMIIFIAIAFLGSVFLIMINAYTNFILRKKEAALLTILGLAKKDLLRIFYLESLFLTLSSVFFSFVLSFVFMKVGNIFFEKQFYFQDLIILPLKTFLNIPYFLVFICFFLAFFLSYVFTFLPMQRFKKKPLIDELKEE
ncbi:MAG: ABC transporter permease [Bacilli bacterium]|jgi:ABC-type antimicrobial peptide transport system permease subunit|nr:ABC transporter permease [Bacilli bacterium]